MSHDQALKDFHAAMKQANTEANVELADLKSEMAKYREWAIGKANRQRDRAVAKARAEYNRKLKELKIDLRAQSARKRDAIDARRRAKIAAAKEEYEAARNTS